MADGECNAIVRLILVRTRKNASHERRRMLTLIWLFLFRVTKQNSMVHNFCVYRRMNNQCVTAQTDWNLVRDYLAT